MNDEVRNDENELTDDELQAQEQADFVAAFSDEDAEPPQGEVAEPETEQPQADPSPQDQGPEEKKLTAEDIDRIRRDALEEGRMKAAADAKQEYTKRIRDLSGELGGYKQKLKDLETARAAARDAGDAPSNADVKDAISNGGKLLEDMREDFPEIASVIDAVRQEIDELRKAQTVTPEAEAPQAAPESTGTADEDAPPETEVLKAQLALTRAHPDWDQVVADKGYQDWLNKQPPHVQQAAQSWDPQDAIGVITLFKSAQQSMTSERETTAPERRRPSPTQRLESAVAPTSGKHVARRDFKSDEEEFLEAFNS